MVEIVSLNFMRANDDIMNVDVSVKARVKALQFYDKNEDLDKTPMLKKRGNAYIVYTLDEKLWIISYKNYVSCVYFESLVCERYPWCFVLLQMMKMLVNEEIVYFKDLICESIYKVWSHYDDRHVYRWEYCG